MLKLVFLIFTSYIGKSIFILWISFIWWYNEYKHINLFGQFLTLSLQGCQFLRIFIDGGTSKVGNEWIFEHQIKYWGCNDILCRNNYIWYISVRECPIPLWLYFLKNSQKESLNNFPKHPPKTAPSIFHRFFFFTGSFCHLACCSSCPTNDFCGLLWPPPLNS